MNDKKCNSGFDKDHWPARNDCPNWHECDDGFYSFCMCDIIEKARADERQKIIISLYQLDWINIFREAYEMRKTSWESIGHIRELRNATDEVMNATIRALKKQLAQSEDKI